MEPPNYKSYLGDGCYAEFDSYQIWLTTLEGHRIALESEVYLALQQYVTALRTAIQKESSPCPA